MTAPARGPRPQVFVHIGEPKTGTTFLQQVMWGNRAALAARGVILPGHHGQDHYRASQDLRGIEKLASDPAGSWTGEWEILAAEARQAPRAAVISHELFCAVDEPQAEAAVRSLRPADVHVVITVRDMASLLTAEWQETVKHRNTRAWEDWLGDVIDREAVDPDRRQWWFWRVHDTLAIAALWARHVPADRIHLITMPPRGSSPTLLWDRFADLIGVDADGVDLSHARANASLGLADIEFLRRLNQALPEEVPNWFYMWNVKEAVAHRPGVPPRGGRLVLPTPRADWAAAHAEELIDALGQAKYDLIGDLGELRPQPASGPAVSPADEPAGDMLAAAVDAAAAMVVNQYHREYPPGRGGPPGARGLINRVESAVAASPRLKRAVREASSRSAAVRQLRVRAWQAQQRIRARRAASRG